MFTVPRSFASVLILGSCHTFQMTSWKRSGTHFAQNYLYGSAKRGDEIRGGSSRAFGFSLSVLEQAAFCCNKTLQGWGLCLVRKVSKLAEPTALEVAWWSGRVRRWLRVKRKKLSHQVLHLFIFQEKLNVG